MGYGDVDGKDFWSFHNGERIVHKGITEVTDSFTALLEWIDGEGAQPLIRFEELDLELRQIPDGWITR